MAVVFYNDAMKNIFMMGLIAAYVLPGGIHSAHARGLDYDLSHQSGAQAMQTDEAAFDAWRTGYLARAQAAGIPVETLRLAGAFLQYNEKTITLDRKQPEKTQKFSEYLARTVTPSRIARARAAYADNRAALQRAEAEYGVPAHVIVALWAMESDLGKHQGNFNILSALATLAYEGRRRAFFESELTAALQMVASGIPPASLTGSWAGAMGMCQFMPSSYLKFAVDANGDGRADIWKSADDTFHSIANYLRSNGWQSGEEIAREFNPENEQNLVENNAPLWHHRPVVQPTGAVPAPGNAPLMQPDGPGGQTFLAYDNARVLMRWNRSTYFVLAIAELARQINPNTHPDS